MGQGLGFDDKSWGSMTGALLHLRLKLLPNSVPCEFSMKYVHIVRVGNTAGSSYTRAVPRLKLLPNSVPCAIEVCLGWGVGVGWGVKSARHCRKEQGAGTIEGTTEGSKAKSRAVQVTCIKTARCCQTSGLQTGKAQAHRAHRLEHLPVNP
jgi:hypothetical protein